MKKGFIVIPREFFSSKAWNEKRRFSHFEAWVDLRQMARFGFGSHEVRMGGSVVTVGRNELCSTLSALALRWDWSTKCVRMFLVRLEREGLARVTATRSCTLIRLVAPDTETDAKGTAEGTAQGTAEGTRDCLIFNAITDAGGTAEGTPQGTAEGTDKNKVYKEESFKEEESVLSSLREESGEPPAPPTAKAAAAPVRSRKRSPAFVPPDYGEVEAYCRSAGLTDMNPEQFYDHYESVGWMAGRQRIRNWQAAARKWNRAEPAFRSRDGTAAARPAAEKLTPNPVTVQNLFNDYDRNLLHAVPRRRPDKRVAAAEALRDYHARQVGYIARMDAEEPDF